MTPRSSRGSGNLRRWKLRSRGTFPHVRVGSYVPATIAVIASSDRGYVRYVQETSLRATLRLKPDVRTPPARAEVRCMSFNIFLVYRRYDTGSMTGRIYERLETRFGREKIFVDIDPIPVGCDFVEYLEQAIVACRAMVVMIGPNWLGIDHKGGPRRIDRPLDYLRLELEIAIGHGVTLIPVLVDGASMPARSELPETIATLADQPPIPLNGHRFALDYAVLEQRVQELMRAQQLASSDHPASARKADRRDHFFVSYAREDGEFAKRLALGLQAEGIPVWMDVLHIKTGKAREDQIEQALKSAAGLVFVMSRNSIDSDTVKDELSLAIDLGKPVVPVRIDGCEPPLRLRRVQYADFFMRFDSTHYDRAFRRLVSDLRDSAEVAVARPRSSGDETAPQLAGWAQIARLDRLGSHSQRHMTTWSRPATTTALQKVPTLWTGRRPVQNARRNGRSANGSASDHRDCIHRPGHCRRCRRRSAACDDLLRAKHEERLAPRSGLMKRHNAQAQILAHDPKMPALGLDPRADAGFRKRSCAANKSGMTPGAAEARLCQAAVSPAHALSSAERSARGGTRCPGRTAT